jgi:hypothetical protein
MEELAQLKNTLKCKPHRNSVPRAVSYWLFFKRHILERADVRVRFQQAEPPLDEDGFRRLVKTAANPRKWGPSFCRQRRGTSAKTAKRNTNDMLAVLWRYYEALLHPASPIYVADSTTGLGVFARRTVRVDAGSTLFTSHLWGVPFQVSEDDFAELHASKYPSLYRKPNGSAYILCGPLALVTHQCCAPLAFSLPKKMPAPPSPASPPAASRAARRLGPALEEFAGLSAVHALASARCRVAKGQEIVVDYFGQDDPSKSKKSLGSISFAGGAECQCLTCVAGGSSE